MRIKNLIVGIGGSGGATLRFMAGDLDRRLRAAGWEEGVPDNFQFIHIDLPSDQEGREAGVPVGLLEENQYLGLGNTELQYKHYDKAWSENPESLKMMVGWRPNPSDDYPAPHNGAGQRRAVGRVVTVEEIGKVGARIDQALNTLDSPSTLAQFNRLHSLPAFANATVADLDKGVVTVISSIAGGSGSGAFLDVIEQLRARSSKHAWLDSEMVTVLFAPDLFNLMRSENTKPGSSTDGLEPNSLAAISEWLNHFEHTGPVPAPEAAIVARGGHVAFDNQDRRVGPTAVFIGARNGKVSFETIFDGYQYAAGMLSAAALEGGVGEKIWSYLINDVAVAVSDKFLIADTTATPVAATSFGYGKVSLGRDIFESYVAERVSRVAIDRILKAETFAQKPGEKLSSELLAKNIAAREKSSFFEQSGLFSVKDGIATTRVASDIGLFDKAAELISSVVDAIDRKLNEDANEDSGSRWYESIEEQYGGRSSDLNSRLTSMLNDSVASWRWRTEKRLLRLTAESVVRHGIPVTLELIDLLAKELNATKGALESWRADYSTQASSLRDQASRLLTNITDKIGFSKPEVGQAIDLRGDEQNLKYNADVAHRAAGLQGELADGVIQPIRESLVQFQKSLAGARAGLDREAIESWSKTAVPKHLEPGQHEKLLEPTSMIPEIYTDRIVATYPELHQGVDVCEIRAASEVVSGEWPSNRVADERIIDMNNPGPLPKTFLFDITTRWGENMRAAYKINLSPMAIRKRATEWAGERRGPVADTVHENLQEWLAPTHPDIADRLTLFKNRMIEAAACAEPVVSIEDMVYRGVHGGERAPFKYLLSPIPLDPGSDVATKLIDELVAFGVDRDDIEFQPSLATSDVSIYGFPDKPMHPVVFSSIFSPVINDWYPRSESASRRAAFWAFARSRPLTAFVPMSRDKTEAMVRGWLTARAMGQFPELNGQKWSEAPRTIWSPAGRHAFPRFLLGLDESNDARIIAGMLETLPIAIAERAAGNEEPVAAYVRMLKLGERSGGNLPNPFQIGYEELNGEFAAWLGGGPEPWNEVETPLESRLAKAKDVVESVAGFYQELADTPVTDAAVISRDIDRAWEVRELVSTACEQLLTRLNEV